MPSISVFLPQTAEDVLNRAGMIMACICQDEGASPDPDIIDWLAEHPHTLYLFFDGFEPLGMIRLDDRAANPALGKGTVEIHGAILPKYRGQSDGPTLFVLEEAFKVKKNVIAKVEPSNLGAKGWLRKWGFTRINREDGLDVYRLRRGDFMRANHAYEA